MQTTIEADLARVEAEIAKQDAEWNEAKERLLALGDVQLELDPETLGELEASSQPKLAGTIPAGFVRA